MTLLVPTVEMSTDRKQKRPDEIDRQLRRYLDLPTPAPSTPDEETGEQREGETTLEGRRDHHERPALNMQERVRRLPLHEVHTLARSGQLAERVALERIYGKAVWESLLQNPNLTPAEVARIARMGSLPKPLLESIAARPAWVATSLVRRALLTHPRLGGRSLNTILRALPKAELKLVPKQTAYPARVREAAKRLLGR